MTLLKNQLSYWAVPKGFKKIVSSNENFEFKDRKEAIAPDWQTDIRALANTVDLLICITLYNESGEALLYSLAAIQQNINYLMDIGREDIATGITVCIIADGQAKMSDSMASMLTDLGLYGAEYAEDTNVDLHLFESRLSALALHEQVGDRQTDDAPSSNWQAIYTAAGYDHEHLITSHPTTMVTPRVLFCLKPRNAGKLDSHWWFFQVFCAALQPKYCVQMDVGSVPQAQTLYLLRSHLENNPDVGAATNSLLTPEPRNFGDVLSLWQYTNFAFANFIHSPAEQLSGYVSVMCGQFSLFRWRALSQTPEKSATSPEEWRSPLDSYFEQPQQPTMLKANMALTEDRVLCLALKTNPSKHWQLAYVPQATTITDSCYTLPELLQQRRRWLNGAMACRFALLKKIFRIFLSIHTPKTKKWDLFRGLCLYATKASLEWFNFTLSQIGAVCILQITLDATAKLNFPPALAYGIFWIGIVFYGAGIFLCLTERLTASFLKASCLYISVYIFVVCLLALMAGNFWPIGIISIGWLAACLSAIAYSPNLAAKAAQYFIPMLITDTVVSPLLNIYAVHNIGDVSWGTKGKVGKRGYRRSRQYFIIFWLLSNSLLFTVITLQDLFIPVTILQFSPQILGGIAGIVVGFQSRNKEQNLQLRKVFSPIP